MIVGYFLSRIRQDNKAAAIASDRWGLVSGLIRALTLLNASHACRTHENADYYARDYTGIYLPGIDNARAKYDAIYVRHGIWAFRLRCTNDHYTFFELCQTHRNILFFIERCLNNGASFSHFAAVLRRYDNDLGQAVTAPCVHKPTVGQMIRKIHVRARNIMASYSSQC